MKQALTAPYFHLKEVDSTNDFLKRKQREEGLEEGTAVSADFQQKGRGQNSKIWISLKGENLLFSMFIEPSRKGNPYVLNMMVTVAVCRLLEELSSKICPVIKWPNDVLIDESKISGILIENSVRSPGQMRSFIGVGLNVNQEVFPDMERAATSLKLLVAKDFEIEALGRRLQELIWELYTDGAWEDYVKEYNDRLYKVNAHCDFIHSDGRKFRADSYRVNTDGQLVVVSEGEELQPFNHGEVKYKG